MSDKVFRNVKTTLYGAKSARLPPKIARQRGFGALKSTSQTHSYTNSD